MGLRLHGVILFSELDFGACVFLVLFIDWNRYWWWLKRRGGHEGLPSSCEGEQEYSAEPCALQMKTEALPLRYHSV